MSRDGETRFTGATSTAAMRRSPDELADFLGRALEFPTGAFLMTGTGIVPDASFSLQAGDVVDVDGGPLGTLRNPVERVGRAPSDPALPD